MAFTANTAFEARVTNNRFNDLCNVAGKFGTVADGVLTPADCSAGTLVVPNMLAPCEGYTSVNNENTYYFVAAASTDATGNEIYACNTYDTQLLGDGAGNEYFIGTRTLGLGVPAGRYGNFTKIIFDDSHIYRFGVGNLSNSLSTNKFATIGSSGQITAAASAPTTVGTAYFKVMGTGAFVEGASASFNYVDLKACRVLTPGE